jgi:prepilin-type processing-associated H-X9-DG protein
MNTNLNGGFQSGRFEGPHGLLVDPSTYPLRPSESHFVLASYSLGAKISRFRSPASKFMIVETERGSDVMGSVSLSPSLPDGAIYLGAHPTIPWASSPQPWYGFRHSRNTRANFLFIDGHVELMHHLEDINLGRRYSLD